MLILNMLHFMHFTIAARAPSLHTGYCLGPTKKHFWLVKNYSAEHHKYFFAIFGQIIHSVHRRASDELSCVGKIVVRCFTDIFMIA